MGPLIWTVTWPILLLPVILGVRKHSVTTQFQFLQSESKSPTDASHARRKLFDRDCALEDCAAGKAWGFTIFYAFTRQALRSQPHIVDKFQEVTHDFMQMAPCIQFLALDGSRGDYKTFEKEDFEGRSTQAPLEGVILVDSKQRHDCFSQGVGFPGIYGMRYMSLGACSHISGLIMHELLHAMGFNHEQNRADSAQSYEGQGPHIELLDIRPEDMPQYQIERQSYIGSRASGGYAPFDFRSVMMYAAGKEFRTLPDGKYNKITGNRESLSDGDVQQLRDMYGCLEPTGAVCPTSAASRDVDADGDCMCPPGTQCFAGEAAGCSCSRSHGLCFEYFSVLCKTCRCIAERCPGSALPDAQGDCACQGGTWCMEDGRAGCASSRSSRDFDHFHSSCQHCSCVPKRCAAQAKSYPLVNDEGHCECPSGTTCQDLKVGAPGCPIENYGISTRYFSARCQYCKCEEAHRIGCPRQATSGTPDGEGDCMCSSGHTCYNGDYGDQCPYSGGKSSVYFSVACTNCQCVPRLPSGAITPYRSYYVKHTECNTKCGAKHATLDPYLWNLQGASLDDDTCGECRVVRTKPHDWTSCQDHLLDGEDFQLFSSHTHHSLCCRKLPCSLEEETCDKRGWRCEENADCVHDRASDKAICRCKDGFETTPHNPRADGFKCSPVRPPGAKCCGWSDRYMWVPKDLLDTQLFCGEARLSNHRWCEVEARD